MNNFDINRIYEAFLVVFFLFYFFFNGLKGQDIDNLETLRKSSESDTKLEKIASVDLYLIFNNKGDTIHIDTTLTIKKHYKFNYLRKIILRSLNFQILVKHIIL